MERKRRKSRRRMKYEIVKTKGSKRSYDFIKKPIFNNEDNCEMFKKLESRAHQAINNKKIFTIIGGYDVLRQSLIGRGWIEKLLDIEANKFTINEKVIAECAGDYDARRIVLSHLVKGSPTYFIWQPKYFDGITLNINYPLRNRIVRMRTFDFTLKEGLHNLAENIQWHIIEDLTELNYPRSYLLMDVYQREHFLQEFRRTLISSFVCYVYDHFDSVFTDYGSVPGELIFNVLNRMEQYIKIKQDLYIDNEKMSSCAPFSEITKQIDLVLNLGRRIKFPEFYDDTSREKLKFNLKVITSQIRTYWPESKYDGNFNIWILKPINRSRGIGVKLMKDCEKMFDFVLKHTENKYIVQKYVGKIN
jgi:tubulin monoglycylase TTLL3/8